MKGLAKALLGLVIIPFALVYLLIRTIYRAGNKVADVFLEGLKE